MGSESATGFDFELLHLSYSREEMGIVDMHAIECVTLIYLYIESVPALAMRNIF